MRCPMIEHGLVALREVSLLNREPKSTGRSYIPQVRMMVVQFGLHPDKKYEVLSKVQREAMGAGNY